MSNTIREFVRIANAGGINGYSDEGALRKKAFHSKGRAVLRAVAQEMGLQSGSYDIRSNLGGIAGSGEVTLHGEKIYIQFSESCQPGLDILFRRCEGRKDYCGKQNNWMRWEFLLDLPGACEQFIRVAQSE